VLSADWESELRKLKQESTEEITETQKEDRELQKSYVKELKKLMKLVRSQLIPVAEIFREEGKTETQQPHIHEYEYGFTLVLPVAENGVTYTTFQMQFEFHQNKKGFLLKVNRKTEEGAANYEKTITMPITKEKIRDEIRNLLKVRQDIIFTIRKEQNQT
jgi:hypothetical protein